MAMVNIQNIKRIKAVEKINGILFFLIGFLVFL